ncbi:unnamed protein product, partial [Urochloa humidicola]
TTRRWRQIQSPCDGLLPVSDARQQLASSVAKIKGKLAESNLVLGTTIAAARAGHSPAGMANTAGAARRGGEGAARRGTGGGGVESWDRGERRRQEDGGDRGGRRQKLATMSGAHVRMR